MAVKTGERILHQIVSTVASSLELPEVLRAVVRLMSDASGEQFRPGSAWCRARSPASREV